MLKAKEEYNAYMNSYMKERYRLRRLRAVEMLGSKCVHCGCAEELEFDHIDPKSKYNIIAKLSSASEKIFSEEVSKCQLLCRPCHVKKSRDEGSYGDVLVTKTCDCGEVFGSIKAYAGHRRWCVTRDVNSTG